MASDDPRRVVVIDPATDSVTTIIGKASAAPGVGELRERTALAIYVFEGQSVSNIRCREIADAVLRVILGEVES